MLTSEDPSPHALCHAFAKASARRPRRGSPSRRPLERSYARFPSNARRNRFCKASLIRVPLDPPTMATKPAIIELSEEPLTETSPRGEGRVRGQRSQTLYVQFTRTK